jgi:hypothetical protein
MNIVSHNLMRDVQSRAAINSILPHAARAPHRMNNNSPPLRYTASAPPPLKNINGARLHLNLSDCLCSGTHAGALSRAARESNFSADKMRLAGEKWAPSAASRLRDNQICKYWTCDESSFQIPTISLSFIYGLWAAMALSLAYSACCTYTSRAEL